MKLRRLVILALTLTLLPVLHTSAGTTPFAGVIAAGPTFNRPTNLTTLSVSGTAVYYTVIPFTVDTAGGYTITQMANTPVYDGYLFEYITLFDPASPLTNLKNGDDDFGGTSASQIAPGDSTNYVNTNDLVAGAQYYVVSSGYSNGSTGSFTGTITGPGTATLGAVPEPSAWALLGVGAVAAAGGVMRRRRLA